MQKEYTAESLVASKTNQITAKSVGGFFEELIKQFTKANRLGYARSFRYTSNSLKRFCGNNLDFPFHDIDVGWLSKYEQWLKSNNCSEVTIAILFRTVRSAYNKAIIAKCALKSSYPFTEYKVSKFDTSTQKRAIPKEAIKKIMSVDLSKGKFNVQFSRDIFIFSYLCGGVNFTDIANLKYSNVINNKLSYIRQKTKKKINTPLSDEALQIISRYGKVLGNDDYILPILDRKIHKTEVQKTNRIQKVMGAVNRHLKIVAKLAGINANLTTYVARHSFATVLKNSGVNIALISETLGHSDIATTQIYLDSFESEQIGEVFKHLL